MVDRRRIPDQEYATPDAKASSARQLLIRAINKFTPEVFQAIVENVLPVWLSETQVWLSENPNFDPVDRWDDPTVDKGPSKKMNAVLEAWAREYHVDFDWILRGTDLMLAEVCELDGPEAFSQEKWELYCGFVAHKKYPFKPPVLRLSWDPQVPLGTHANPSGETHHVHVEGTRKGAQRVFAKAIESYFDEVEKLATTTGLTRTEEKRGDKGDVLDHFEWLALRLVRQEKWYQISKVAYEKRGRPKIPGKTNRLSRRTVKEGVRSACNLTGIPVEAVGLPSE